MRCAIPPYVCWDTTLGAFVKVTPKDYRRALLELKPERDAEAARMAAAE